MQATHIDAVCSKQHTFVCCQYISHVTNTRHPAAAQWSSFQELHNGGHFEGILAAHCLQPAWGGGVLTLLTFAEWELSRCVSNLPPSCCWPTACYLLHCICVLRLTSTAKQGTTSMSWRRKGGTVDQHLLPDCWGLLQLSPLSSLPHTCDGWLSTKSLKAVTAPGQEVNPWVCPLSFSKLFSTPFNHKTYSYQCNKKHKNMFIKTSQNTTELCWQHFYVETAAYSAVCRSTGNLKETSPANRIQPISHLIILPIDLKSPSQSLNKARVQLPIMLWCCVRAGQPANAPHCRQPCCWSCDPPLLPCPVPPIACAKLDGNFCPSRKEQKSIWSLAPNMRWQDSTIVDHTAGDPRQPGMVWGRKGSPV